MTDRHKRIRKTMKGLSDIDWGLLNRESDESMEINNRSQATWD
jgi:hypothetical protein